MPPLRQGGPHPLTWTPEADAIVWPDVPERATYYRDVALLAVPEHPSGPEAVVDLSARMAADGTLDWTPPPGRWTLYRFGHTLTGCRTQPNQWAARGFECDKVNPAAVDFHIDHVIALFRRELGRFAGTVMKTIYFDSYEAGEVQWTPAMPAEFAARRGYSLLPYLPIYAGVELGGKARADAFRADVEATVREMFREHYWDRLGRRIHAAGFRLGAEPYDGQWDIARITPPIDTILAEFWTGKGYAPLRVDELREAVWAQGKKILAAEAFTTAPDVPQCQWTATPGWLKTIGDRAFCDGVNRMVLHHFVHQPYGDHARPGMAMGQWGIQFGRYQTWWEPGKAWTRYLARCQSLLQRGQPVPAVDGGSATFAGDAAGALRSIHRRDGETDLFFVANTDPARPAAAIAQFPAAGRQPEWWDPVQGTMRDLPIWSATDGRTALPLALAPAESGFVLFRRAARPPVEGGRGVNFPRWRPALVLTRPWEVTFDPEGGGPGTLVLDTLVDWTTHADPGVRHYSGTARYGTRFDLPAALAGKRLFLDLGRVRHLAAVTVNGRALGVVWTAPWGIELGDAVRAGSNRLEIAVTNCWQNRLLGDAELPDDCVWGPQEPLFRCGSPLATLPAWVATGAPRPEPRRHAFTSWDYFRFTRPALDPSGLLGPVRLLVTDDA